MVLTCRSISTILLLVATLALPSCNRPSQRVYDDPVPNQLIIGWQEPVPARLLLAAGAPPSAVQPGHGSGVSLQAVIDLLQRHRFERKLVLMEGRAWLAESIPDLTNRDLEQVASAIRADPIVRYVSPNHRVHFNQSSPTADDPYYWTQWNLNKIDVEGAWAVTPGSRKVVIAVVDTGVDVDRPDLQKGLWKNPCEIPNGVEDPCSGSSISNDLAGDVHGWNFASNDAVLNDNAPHGTAVASIIAAGRNNENQIAGIGDLSVAVLKTTNGTESDVAHVIKAFDYARLSGMRVATASFTTASDESLEESMTLAGDAGMIVVAAAGDDKSDLDVASQKVYPASFDMDWVISVLASDENDQRATDSNHGSTVIELAAPGVAIPSLLPGSGAPNKRSGSSMAVPHVAGVIGLILSIRPDATLEQIRSCLAKGDPGFADSTVWKVRLNARKAVEACQPESPPTTPDPPSEPVLITR